MKNIFSYQDKNFSKTFLDFLKTRQQTNAEIMSLVEKVIEDVRINKDAAVIKYTKKFDNVNFSLSASCRFRRSYMEFRNMHPRCV